MPDLDRIDRSLLTELQLDDRLSLAELGRRAGLSTSATKERIDKLVARGVILGFRAELAPEVLGLDLLAFVFVGWSDPGTEEAFLARIAEEGHVLECHHVTGVWNYLLKIRVANTRLLESFLNEVVKNVPGVQRTETIICLSTRKETLRLPVGG